MNLGTRDSVDLPRSTRSICSIGSNSTISRDFPQLQEGRSFYLMIVTSMMQHQQPIWMAFVNTCRQDSKTAAVWEELSIDCRLEARETPLFCVNNNGSTATTADDRLTYQGQIYVAAMLAPAAGIQLGDVWLEYDVSFFIPAIESQPTTAVSGNTGTTQPSLVDALKPYVSGVPGQTTTGNTLASLLPKNVPGIVNSAIQVAEGTYRMINTALTAMSSVNSFAPPTVVANAPEPLPAVQASVRQILNIPSNATTASPYVSDYIIAIPRGGGYIQQGMGNYTATANTLNFDIQKLSNSAAFASNYF